MPGKAADGQPERRSAADSGLLAASLALALEGDAGKEAEAAEDTAASVPTTADDDDDDDEDDAAAAAAAAAARIPLGLA
jgi:hypothetical protein